MYSWKGKGVWAPFVGRDLEQGGWGQVYRTGKEYVKDLYATNNPVKASAKLLGRSTQNLFSLGHSTGGFVGGKWLNEKSRRTENVLKNIYKSNINEAISNRVDLTYEVRKQLYSTSRKEATSVLIGTRNKDLYYREKYLNYGGELTKKPLPWRTAAKWGIRGAKVASYVGLAMFAWDMINMVGEPIGRSLLGAVDKTMTDYQQRFMPEVGGRLALSYLSQGAATERQRSLNALSKSSLSGRTGFGGEASMQHVGY
jgi:hypothetical protein